MGKIKLIMKKKISKTDFINSWKKRKLDIEKRSEEIMKEIPKIHWEILSYSNNHTKDEVIKKYPEHINFINKIVWK